MGWHHDWMGGMGGWMFPGFGLIIIVILVALVFWALSGGRLEGRSTGISGSEPSPSETPMDIVKRRYAEGEITREEFEQMKKDLVE